MKKIFSLLLNQHFVIALSASSLCLQTTLFYSQAKYPYSFFSFIFFATLLSYNLHFSLAAKKNISTNQLRWYRNHEKLAFLSNIISFVATFFFWYEIRPITIPILLAIFLNLSYTAPLLLKKPIKLPSIFTFLKSYFIGFVWAYVTVILPLKLICIEINFKEQILFVSRLLLVALATMIFDYRDKNCDLRMGIKTPANTFNEDKYEHFFMFNIFLYSIFICILAFFYKSPIHLLQIIPGFITFYLFKKSKQLKSDYFYLLWVDGLLILATALSLLLLL